MRGENGHVVCIVIVLVLVARRWQKVELMIFLYFVCSSFSSPCVHRRFRLLSTRRVYKTEIEMRESRGPLRRNRKSQDTVVRETTRCATHHHHLSEGRRKSHRLYPSRQKTYPLHYVILCHRCVDFPSQCKRLYMYLMKICGWLATLG